MIAKVIIPLVLCFVITNTIQSALPPDLHSGRIVHGSDAAEGQFPFYASIKSKTAAGTVKLCGGSLIATQWILTAAQCVQGYASFEIGLGSTSLKSPTVTRIALVNKAHVNPLFDPNTMYQDVALIEIAPVILSATVKVIELPWWIYGYDDFFVNLNTQAMGFGQLANGTSPDKLQFVDIVTIPTPSCRAIYGSNVIGTDKICANAVDPKQNICHEDFGGPLIYRNATMTVQIGIASFLSVLSCDYGYPSAYTRVESTLNFVHYITGMRVD